ncbi:hypothetical protein AL065_28010 [Pseudomonas amygdali pv. ulmi]|nr:hypothetical protein AL065_28010 [Pseudomonas amygdali pv. ulmi]PAB32578.1 hypothetical protein CCZ00_12945 [Pseudomonas savastanoi pv. fraxini]
MTRKRSAQGEACALKERSSPRTTHAVCGVRRAHSDWRDAFLNITEIETYPFEYIKGCRFLLHRQCFMLVVSITETTKEAPFPSSKV